MSACLTWHPSQGQQKLFFQGIILLLSSMLSLRSMFDWKWYGSRAAITLSGTELKNSSEAIWKKSIGQNNE